MKRLTSYSPLIAKDSDFKDLSRKIETGFPSPASDHLENSLSLEDLIIQRPTSTFYVRAEGNAMNATGIYDGDILVVDRSLTAQNGSIVIVSLNEEVVIRRFVKSGSRIFLVSGNKHHSPIPINSTTDWMIWGVATYLIHKFRNLKTQNSTIKETE